MGEERAGKSTELEIEAFETHIGKDDSRQITVIQCLFALNNSTDQPCLMIDGVRVVFLAELGTRPYSFEAAAL